MPWLQQRLSYDATTTRLLSRLQSAPLYSTQDLDDNQKPISIHTKAPLLKAKQWRWISLVILVVQNTLLVLCLHASRQSHTSYNASVAVSCMEALKLITTTLYVSSTCGLSYLPRHFKTYFFSNWLSMSVPAILYAIQNNILYLALSHLDASTFQVTYQFKLLVTALLAVWMLHKKLTRKQWIALIVLTMGVMIVTFSTMPVSTATVTKQTRSFTTGLFCVFLACLTSAFSGIYFEKQLKSNRTDIWTRNVQLSLFSFLASLFPLFHSDTSSLFEGFTPLVWIVIILQSLGGLLVAAVIQYADNIAKGFATSASIVLSCIANQFLYGTEYGFLFVLGSSFVLLSTFLYST